MSNFSLCTNLYKRCKGQIVAFSWNSTQEDQKRSWRDLFAVSLLWGKICAVRGKFCCLWYLIRKSPQLWSHKFINLLDVYRRRDGLFIWLLFIERIIICHKMFCNCDLRDAITMNCSLLLFLLYTALIRLITNCRVYLYIVFCSSLCANR